LQGKAGAERRRCGLEKSMVRVTNSGRAVGGEQGRLSFLVREEVGLGFCLRDSPMKLIPAK